MTRWLAWPGLHFLLLGAVLFVADRALEREVPARRSIEIGAGRLDALRAEWNSRAGEAPDEAAFARWVDAEIDDEILLREARARGFAERDPVVRARLARNIGFLAGEDERSMRAGDAGRVDEALALGLASGDLVVRRRLIERLRAQLSAGEGAHPDEAEIEARFARDRARYAGPARVRLCHVFLARERRGATLEADARQLRERIAAERLGIDSAVTLGDPFLLGHSFPPRSEADLARAFGEGFAREVLALEPGRLSEPIASSYGLHLVLVHDRSAAVPAALADTRARISEELVREREADALRLALERLRAQYDVQIAEVGP